MALRFSAPASNPTNWYGAFAGPLSIGIPNTVLFWAMVSLDRNNYQDIICLNYVDAPATPYFANFCGCNTDGTTLHAWDGDGGRATLSGRAMTVGSWYRFGNVVNTTTTGTLYHGTGDPSSALTATAYDDAADAPLRNTSDWLYLTGVTSQSACLNGRIAAIKVYNAALTSAEVQAELMRYRPVRVANLQLWLPCEERDTTLNIAGDRTVYAADRGPATEGASKATSSSTIGPTFEDGPPISW